MLNPIRSRAYSENEWHEANYKLLKKSDFVRDEWKRACEEARYVLREREMLTQSSQETVTGLIQERAREIFRWKREFQRIIDDLISVTQIIHNHKKQIENAINAIDLSLMINSECLALRRQRVGLDLADDSVQSYLLREEELLTYVKVFLLKSIPKVEDQIKINNNFKAKLEEDWTDKWEAYKIDSFCVHLDYHFNESVPFHYGWEELPERWNTVNSWLESIKESLMQCSNEITTSKSLCKAVETLLKDYSSDVQDHRFLVDLALNERIVDLNRSIYQLKEHLKILVEDMSIAEKTIEKLTYSLKEKQQPLKIAQTRLHYRFQRPNKELIRDPAQESLIKEIQEIEESMSILKKQIGNSQTIFMKLVEVKKIMEKHLIHKEHALSIDKDRVVPVRKRFPSQYKLMGYE
ncbi:tektin-4-like isoform X1 [Centruroides vittatus]|uniref:tektin-4-like isoform X1 n=1 Tax=Centruroides vittatus TaxID=120091 RepID=UPI00351083FE